MVADTSDDIVITGVGCRLPGSNSFDDFAANLLANKYFATQEHTRWPPNSRRETHVACNYMTDPSYFDNIFFGIAAAPTSGTDPFLRLSLESTLEALVDAGLTEADIKGTNTTVYSGSSKSEFEIYWREVSKDGYNVMGRNRAMQANRVSFWLDARGSSVSLDCSWVSGMHGIEMAINDIKKGRTETAVIITGNMILDRNIQEVMEDSGILSPDGKSRPYSEEGNGIVRCEGIIALILQKSSAARRSYATVVDVFTTCYGSREHYTRSSVWCWSDVFKQFYERSSVKPEDIGYIEGYGCGLKDEDEKELEAIENFFCKERKEPLLLGSVKSNYGHAESAAIALSILKIITAFKHNQMAGNHCFDNPIKSSYGLASGSIQILSENTKLPENKLVAVNALGLAGNYGHLVLGPPKLVDKKKEVEVDELPWLLLLSTRKSDAIPSMIEKVQKNPFDRNYYHLINKTFNVRRENYLGRGYLVTKDKVPLASSHDMFQGTKRQVWFIFAGMGSQWNKMGKDLLNIPIIKRSLEESHKILEKKGLNLMEIITTEDKTIFDNILHAFVGIAAIQVALVDLLYCVGIKPDGIIGHSVGELGCSYADGCFTAEQIILAAYSRGKASIETELIPGMMAAIGKGYNAIKESLPEDVEVACRNSNTSCTISGPTESVNNFVKSLQQQNVFAKTVNVANIAFHSRYIKPAAPKLLQYLKDVVPDPKPRSEKWVSTSVPEAEWGSELSKYCSAEYHTNNLLSPVLFEEGCHSIPKDALCIEIAPHGLLQPILKRSLAPDSYLLSLTNRSAKDGSLYLLEALGKIHMQGIEFDINKLYAPVEYPVPKSTPGLAQLVDWVHERKYDFTRDNYDLKTIHKIDVDMCTVSNNWILNNRTYLSPSYLLKMVWDSLKVVQNDKTTSSVVFEDVRIHKWLEVKRPDRLEFFVRIQKSGRFEVAIGDEEAIITGNINFGVKNFIKLNELGSELYQVEHEDIYSELNRRGHGVTHDMDNLKRITAGDAIWVADINFNGNWLHLFESMFHMVMLKNNEPHNSFLLPCSIGSLSVTDDSPDNTNDQVFKVIYDHNLNIIQGPNFELRELKWSEMTKVEDSLLVTQPRFIPFDQPDFMTTRMFIDFVLDIVKENVDMKAQSKLQVAVVSSGEDHPVPELIDNVLNEYEPKHEVNVFVVATNNNEWPESEVSDLILAESDSLDVAAQSKNGFVLLFSRQKLVNSPKTHSVITSLSSVQNLHIYLLKRTFEFSSVFIDLPLNLKDSGKGLPTKNNTNKVVYLVSRQEPDEGIPEFVSKLNTETGAPYRYLFILDKTAPDFEPTSSFYNHQLKKGLSVNVYNMGAWGSYQEVNFYVHPVVDEKNVLPEASNGIRITNVGKQEIQSDGKILAEFGGLNDENEKVMGLAVFDEHKVFVDQYLTWIVPKSWSLEEAATVPLSYCLGLYSVLVQNILSDKTRLITGVCSENGLAALSMSVGQCDQLFVTVENELEKEWILQKFPSLKPGNVLYHSSDNFQVFLRMKTLGLGVATVFNTLSGDGCRAAMECGGQRSNIYHVGNEDLKQNTVLGLGLYDFLSSITPVNANTILQLDPEFKKKIKKNIGEGIQNGKVEPLLNIPSSIQQVSSRTTDNNNTNHIEASNYQTLDENFRISSQQSYIVIGDKTEDWLDLVECLVKSGATKIVVAHSKSKKNARRIHSLTNNIKIKLKRYSSLVNVRADDILRDARNLGCIGAVFIVSKEGALQDSKLPYDLDNLWREPGGHFVCFLNNDNFTGLRNICKNRNTSGLQSTAVHISLNNKIDIQEIFGNLNKLLKHGPVVHVSKKHNNERDLDLDEVLTDTLPLSLDELRQLGSSVDVSPSLVQLHTLCRQVKTGDTATLVFIPGLDDDPSVTLGPLVTNLLYPAYYCKWSVTQMSIDNMAGCLAEKIKSELGEEVDYNIVGLSWGNLLALKLSKHLEDCGKRVKVFLVGYSHVALMSAINSIKTTLPQYLLSRYVESTLDCDINDWESALQQIDSDPHFAHVKQALLTIRNLLTSFSNEDLSSYKCQSAVKTFCKDFYTDKKVNEITKEIFLDVDHKKIHEYKRFLSILHHDSIFIGMRDITEIKEDLMYYLDKFSAAQPYFNNKEF